MLVEINIVRWIEFNMPSYVYKDRYQQLLLAVKINGQEYKEKKKIHLKHVNYKRVNRLNFHIYF